MEDRLKQPIDEDRRVTGLKGWIRVRVQWSETSTPDVILVNLHHVRSIEKRDHNALIASDSGQLLTEETFEQVVSLMELAS